MQAENLQFYTCVANESFAKDCVFRTSNALGFTTVEKITMVRYLPNDEDDDLRFADVETVSQFPNLQILE